MKKTILIVILLCGLLVAGCANTTTHTDDTIKIGGLFGLTGISQQFGEDELRGATMAVEEINANGGINGKLLELVVQDGQTDPQKNLLAYRKLVDIDRLEYIVGPTWGWPAEVLVPHLQTDNVILVSPSTGEADNPAFSNPNFFKTYPAYKLETKVVLEHMEQHGVKEVDMVIAQSSFPDTMKIGFMEMATRTKVSPRTTYKVASADKDYKTVIEKIKANKPDAIYLVLGDYDGMGRFFTQAKELGLNIPIYTYSGCEQQSMLQNYGEAIDGMLYPLSGFRDSDQAFNDKFAARYGSTPLTPAAATAYDAVKMLAVGLEKGEDVESVREGMNAISDYQGASPITGFNENGWPVTNRQYIMKTVKDGKFVTLES